MKPKRGIKTDKADSVKERARAYHAERRSLATASDLRKRVESQLRELEAIYGLKGKGGPRVRVRAPEEGAVEIEIKPKQHVILPDGLLLTNENDYSVWVRIPSSEVRGSVSDVPSDESPS